MSLFNFGGGMLTGDEIEKQIKKGNIIIDPYDPSCINPNSYNLKLYPEIRTYDRLVNPCDAPLFGNYQFPTSMDSVDLRNKLFRPLSTKEKCDTNIFNIPEDGLTLYPGVLYLGRTVERTATDKFIPMINGRSSGGRLGISIHICAGFGDIGFDGTWTLEITVVEPVTIYPYEEIAQVCFFTPSGSAKKLYRGRYYKQEDATASRFYQGKLKE